MSTTTLKNRIIAAALTVIMVFSMMPTSVFAAGGAVADVDGTQYTDLIAAFDAAQEKTSATVKLLADVATNGRASTTHGVNGIGDYIFEQGNVTFNLNGHTLTWTRYDVYDSSLLVGTNGRLTVCDSGTGGKIYNEETQAINIYAGTLTIQGGTLMSESDKALRIDGGDVSITDGTLHSDSYYGDGVWVNPDTVNNKTVTLTISGGTELIGGTNGSGLYVSRASDENPVVKLSGGTYTGKNGIECNATTVGTLLDEGCRYMLGGSEVTDTGVSTLGSGVTVEANPNAPVKYIDADGNEAQANCAEITAETNDISHGWYVLKEDVTVSLLNISEEVNVILCDGATLTVSSRLNVGQGSTLNLYWQSAGSGKLTAASISVMGRVTAPAMGMKQIPFGDNGVTFEKCLEHDWEYTNNGDTHTATCKLCGTDGGAVNHSYTGWTDNSDGTHSGNCVCGAAATEPHTPTHTPNPDGATHSTKCSKCGYTTAAEDHDFSSTDEFGDKKCACGARLAAEYDGKQYATLESAIAAAKDGGTVTLQADVGENITIGDGTNITVDLNGKEWMVDGNKENDSTLTVTGGSITVTNGTLKSGYSSKAYTAVVVKGGKLTVGEGMIIEGGSMTADKQFPAIEVTGGELTLTVGAKLDGGMKVSAEGKQLKDYLPVGTAFTVNGTAINGYVTEYSSRETLVVAEHSHSYDEDGKCACGVKHRHTGGTASYFKRAVCTTCGAEYGELEPDDIKPTGRITVTERNWFETFINTISFNLFFKQELTGEITAKDDSYTKAGYDENRHAVKIEYIVSNKALTSAELTDWVQYDADKGIDLTGERHYVVYAKLTDHAGNVTLISTDGFVVDTSAPKINGYAGTQTVYICGTAPYEVGVYDENLSEVSVNGVKKGLDETFTFTYSPSGDNTYTVVATDRAENTSSITFILREAHDFNTDTGTCLYCGAAPAVKVQIGDELYPFGSFSEAWREWWYLGEAGLPARIILLQDAFPESFGFAFRDRELTLDLNGHMFGDSNQTFSVAAYADHTCKFTVTGDGIFFSKLQVGTNGHLTVEADAGYIERLEILHNKLGETSPTDWSVSLKGGKFGSIDLRYTDKDGNEHAAGMLGDLLATGYVFDADVASESNATNVQVIPCPAHSWTDGVCDKCKLICGHESITNGICDACGKKVVAKDNNGVFYPTLDAAFASVEVGGTVTLLTDWNLNSEYSFTINKAVTFDLGGKMLRNDRYNAIGTLYITAGATVCNGTVVAPTFTTRTPAINVAYTDGTVTLRDVKTVISDYVDKEQNGVLVTYNSRLIVESGEYTAFAVEDGCHVELRGGTFTAVSGGYSLRRHPLNLGAAIKSPDMDCMVLLAEGYGYVNAAGEAVDGISGFKETVTVKPGAAHPERAEVAQIGNTRYTDIQSAVDAALDGETVTVLTNVNLGTGAIVLDTTKGNTTTGTKSITLDLGGHTVTSQGEYVLDAFAGTLTVQNGTLKALSGSNAGTAAVYVTMEANVILNANVSGGVYVLDSGTLRLTGGTYERGANPTFSLRIGAAKRLNEILGENCLFWEGDTLCDLSGIYMTGKHLTVKPCPHRWENSVCTVCGATCLHDTFENGICTACGYACPHPADKVDAEGEVYTCTVCSAQMAVKVEYIDVNGTLWTKYYAQTYYTSNGVDFENTLQTLLNDDAITPSGSTITLLADGLLALAFVDDGKNIKLDLNGKNLIETVNNGIAVDPGSTLTVTGEGSSTAPANLTENDSTYIFNVRGGTLEFTVFDFEGTFNGIRVESGTLLSHRELEDAITIGTLKIAGSDAKISFKAAAFGKIEIDEGATGVKVKLGDLLGYWKDAEGNTVRSGNAFRYTTGDEAFVRYDTEITKDSPVENVKTAACTHDSVTGRTCDYCGTKNLVAAVIDGGGSIATFAAEDDSEDAKTKSVGYALNWWSQNGDSKAMKLFVDVVLTADTSLNAVKHPADNRSLKTARIIDLNGHTFTGADGNAYGLLANDLVTLTVKDNSTGNKGEFANVTVNDGATLVVDGVKISGVTLNNGCTFTDKGGSYGSITAGSGNLIDFLPTGYAFADLDGNIVNSYSKNLTNVKVAEHTEHIGALWDTTSYKLLCACGKTVAQDTVMPKFDGIKHGNTYYGDVKFKITHNFDFTVTDNGTVITPDEEGYYTVKADNSGHEIRATAVSGNSNFVQIKVYKVYTVTLIGGTGYTVTGASTVGHGQEYEFRVDIRPGYSKTANYKIIVNGVADDEKLAGLGDTYFDTCTYLGAEGNLTVTVDGVADITAPETELTIGTNKFKSFLNTITFGLFFKETQTVTVTAADLGSGVNTVEYLIDTMTFSEDSLPDDGWTEISNFANGKGSFNISPNAMGSVYVRATDKAGNVTVINSDGVVIYTDSTANTRHFTFTRLSTEGKSFNVNLNGNMVADLYITGPNHNGDKIDSSMYMAGSNGNVELENSFLSTLAAGDYTIRVTYRPMGVWYPDKPTVPNAPADTTVKLTVERAIRTTLDFSAPDAVYDGNEYDDLRITDMPGATVIQYKTQGADDSTYTTDAPKNAGNYTVRISVDADKNYNAATFTEDFTVSPKEVTINGVTANSKTYNGNTEATVSGAAAPSVNYDGEDLSVQSGKANFADKNVGTAKTVTFTGFKLSGSAAGNYYLSAQPESVTADITAKEITITGTAVKSAKVYDSKTTAEITDKGTLNGVEDGDGLNIVQGKADYSDKNVGTAKTVTFSGFALEGADKDNYYLSAQPESVTADITAKEVTITGTAVKSAKVYDGKTTAVITADGTLNGVEDGDGLNIVQGKADYSDKNAGVGKTVTFTNFALDGADKGNYYLSAQPESVTADITAKEVTITGTAVKSAKVYDSKTTAVITADGTLNGVEDGDGLNIVQGRADYSDKNVGTAKTVTFSGFALEGADKGNYYLSAQPESVTADIAQKELTVKGLKIKNKQYDGTTAAELEGEPTLAGVVDGDVLSLVPGKATFEKAEVGNGIPVNFEEFLLSGDAEALANYALIQPSGITANIAAYIADGSEYTVSSGDWINTDFVVSARAGYLLSLNDKANGEWKESLIASDETADGKLLFYVKNTASGVISSVVTANYKIDKTVPTGRITFNERTAFEKFISTVTFGLFFKDDVTVELTANDEASGVKSVAYYKSDKALSQAEIMAVTDWTEDNSFGIKAHDTERFVIYVRIEDNAGNVAYISSNGAEFDTTAPTIVGIENGKTYYVTQRAAADDTNLKSVTVNGENVDKNSAFDLAGDKDAVYTVVATDEAGNVTEYTVTMKPISHITDAIRTVTVENVKSSDAETIEEVTRKILDISAEAEPEVIGDEQWNKLLDAAKICKELQKKLASVNGELSRLEEAVGSYDIDKVTSDDKDSLEKLIQETEGLIGGENLTDSEKSAQEEKLKTLNDLLKRIDEAKNAAEKEEITSVRDITESNVTSDDKESLKKAEKALEETLNNYDSNLTDEERSGLKKELDNVKDALKAIDNAEKAADEIKKLPSVDGVKIADSDEVKRIQKIIDSLTESEKAMLGEEAIGKVKSLTEQIKTLKEKADKPASPKTGDSDTLAMWFALLLISGGAVLSTAVIRKKKKSSDEEN